jgi:hypothetical protein
MVSKAFGLSRVADNDLGTFFVDSANNSVAISGQNISPVMSFKNRIINGAMAIDQRNSGAAQTITAAAALAYTVDRWYAYCTGANVTGQRVAGITANNQYMYRFTGASSVTAIGFGVQLELTAAYGSTQFAWNASIEL